MLRRDDHWWPLERWKVILRADVAQRECRSEPQCGIGHAKHQVEGSHGVRITLPMGEQMTHRFGGVAANIEIVLAIVEGVDQCRQ